MTSGGQNRRLKRCKNLRRSPPPQSEVANRKSILKRETINLPGGASKQVLRGGEGDTIVCLHGPHGLRGRDPVLAELTKRYDVVAPLAPGFNNLDEIYDIDTVHDLALHYDSVFDVLGLDRVTLVGHSFGAMI